MRFRLFPIAVALIWSGAAHATGPMLTDLPNPATLPACQKWAAQQDEDTRYMYGQQESGDSDDKVGLDRLTKHCLGYPDPEIVNFGSSAGFDDTFCAKHRGAKICHQR